uniref:Uncharacterized protein n=1 Tax=Angiostrongylus cantonensis TaxID=6313 RepID=A0A0K0CTW2_ANGCA
MGGYDKYFRRYTKYIAHNAKLAIKGRQHNDIEFSCFFTSPEISRSKPELASEVSAGGSKDFTPIRESEKRKKVMIKGITVVEEPIEWTSLDDAVNDDSLEHVIEYTKSHDTMYEFHYLDENNQVCSFEFFNVGDPFKRHDCHSHINDASVVSRPETMVKEQMGQHEGELCDSDLLGVGSQTSTTLRGLDVLMSAVHVRNILQILCKEIVPEKEKSTLFSLPRVEIRAHLVVPVLDLHLDALEEILCNVLHRIVSATMKSVPPLHYGAVYWETPSSIVERGASGIVICHGSS